MFVDMDTALFLVLAAQEGGAVFCLLLFASGYAGSV